MIHLIATLKIDPESLDEIARIVRPCIEETRKEAGCISYDLNQSLSDPGTLVFVERWKDMASLDAHFETPHLKAWREAGGPYFLDRKIEIIEDGKVTTR
jgi:quinol monooxygenase YgiN